MSDQLKRLREVFADWTPVDWEQAELPSRTGNVIEALIDEVVAWRRSATDDNSGTIYEVDATDDAIREALQE